MWKVSESGWWFYFWVNLFSTNDFTKGKRNNFKKSVSTKKIYKEKITFLNLSDRRFLLAVKTHHRLASFYTYLYLILIQVVTGLVKILGSWWDIDHISGGVFAGNFSVHFFYSYVSVKFFQLKNTLLQPFMNCKIVLVH